LETVVGEMRLKGLARGVALQNKRVGGQR
jgi:hypothetical protein